jgi:hypothetical protein
MVMDNQCQFHRDAKHNMKECEQLMSGIHSGYSCKEGGRVEDGLLLEFPCIPTRTRSV